MQQQRDRPGEVERPGRPRAGSPRVAQVGLEVGGRALGGAGQQGAGVGEDQRVVVHVDDRAIPGRFLGDLVGVVGGRQAGADVEELPDPDLRGQVPHGAQERPLARAAVRCARIDRRSGRRTPGRPRSCPCRRASSCSPGPDAPPTCRNPRTLLIKLASCPPAMRRSPRGISGPRNLRRVPGASHRHQDHAWFHQFQALEISGDLLEAAGPVRHGARFLVRAAGPLQCLAVSMPSLMERYCRAGSPPSDRSR